MSRLVPPHGGANLKPLSLEGASLSKEIKRAANLPQVHCSSREFGDVIMLGIGGFTPLNGFMGKGDWEGVCLHMMMTDEIFWPIPITLSTNDESIRIGDDIALTYDQDKTIIATMTVTEKYSIDKDLECISVYKTTDQEHPGVALVKAQGKYNLAGPIKVLSDGHFPATYGDLYMTPSETRAYFEEKGWSNIAAFQTRNPMHRSHEYLAKIAIEICDGVMIHSTLGELKPGDIPAEVRSEAISALIENYFTDNSVLQSGYPLDMRYAGPREALLHALFRQNYGCSHLIVGRDHAGVGDYYGPFDAHNIFDEIPKDALITAPLKIDWTFWCNKCASMASMKTCPHESEDRLLLSGSKLRHLLSENLEVPENFSRSEVLSILRNYYSKLKEDEKVKVGLKGHSAK
jgi:sulfate adenylyltransferase